METTAFKILHYLGSLQDTDYLAEIVNSASPKQLCDTINELLQSEDDEAVSLTCLFVRDLVLFGARHPDCETFLQEYPEFSIVKTLEQLLFSSNHFVRRDSVYTLGKTCSYGSVSVLNQAFSALRDIDPIFLPRLMGEMGWLGAKNFWELVDSMVSSPVYMTRWAVVPMLDEFSGDDARVQNELFRNKFEYVEQLRRDANSLVQLEAEYKYQLLKFSSETYELPEAERRKQRKDLERQYKPAFCFDEISSAFTNYLSAAGSTQYSINELEAFIANRTQPN